ncbi:MAG: hypothetical protein M3Q39_03855 [Actinomycetota bacterium]|nr:hypothetical protein [Actinomycetota bacterium]
MAPALACLALGTALLAVWARDVALGELHGTKIQLLSMMLSAAAVGTALL